MITEREKVIAIIDYDIIKKSDAIILLEGDGLFRYKKAVQLYKDGWASKIVFSGGITDYEYGSFPFEVILPLLVKEAIPESDIIHESSSLNTKEQAIEVIKIAIQNKWKRLILVGTHDHQYRAYLTFLKQIINSNSGLVLYNATAENIGWFSHVPWGTRLERLSQEFIRIEKYTLEGDLCNNDEVIKYQEWKEKQ